MNVSLLLPSEAKAPGGATAPATSIPSGGDDFLKFMGLAGKSRATAAPGETDPISAPTPEETDPSTDAIASNSDGDKLPPNLGTTAYLVDTSLASLRLVLRAVPPMSLSKQVKPAETGAGAEANSKVAQIMDMGQGKTVGEQKGWTRLADNARPPVGLPTANPVKSAKTAPARPPQNSVRSKSPAAAMPVSQAPARSTVPAITKKSAPSLAAPRASSPLAQPPPKINSPTVPDHPVAVTLDTPAKTPSATAPLASDQPPPPNPVTTATSVNASVAIPLISAVVTPTIPLPVPLKLAEKTAVAESAVKTAAPADLEPSTGTGPQRDRTTSSTIKRPAFDGAQLGTPPTPVSGSLAPRSGERVGERGSFVAAAEAEKNVSSGPAGVVSTTFPSRPPVARPVPVNQSNDGAPNLAKISVPDHVSAEPVPTAPPSTPPLHGPVTKAAGLSASTPVAPDDAINDTMPANAAPASPAQFTLPPPKETEHPLAADLQILDQVEKQPAPAPTGQSNPLESLPSAIPIPSGSGHAVVLEPAKNYAPEKSLTSPAPIPQTPAPAEEPAPANDSTSLTLPPPSPGPTANNIIDVRLATPAQSADDLSSVQPGAEAAVKTPVAPSPMDADETVPGNNLAADATDASVTNPLPPSATARPAQIPVSAEINFKTTVPEALAPTPPSVAPAWRADDPPVQRTADAPVNTPIAATPIDAGETKPSNNVPTSDAAHASAADLPPPEPPPLPQTPIIAKTDFKTSAPNPPLPAAVPQVHNGHTASSTTVTPTAVPPAVAQTAPAPSPAPKAAHLAKAVLPDSAKISLQDKLTVEPLLALQPSLRPSQSAAIKEPAPPLSLPATPIGTTVATNQERMKSAVNVNEFAGSTVPALPSAGQVAPSAGVADNGSQGATTARPIEIDFSNNKDTSAQWMVPNITSAGTSSPTTTANSAGSTVPAAAPLAQVERMISREVTMVRQSGAQALAVTLKVDSRTSLFLQLTNHDGQIEASVRCEKGSPAGLDTHWSELQESLARQNVQLLPLQDNSLDQSKTPAGTFADLPGESSSQKQPEPRPEQAAETEPPPSDDAMNAAVGVAKSKHRTHPRHGWEKWA